MVILDLFKIQNGNFEDRDRVQWCTTKYQHNIDYVDVETKQFGNVIFTTMK